ncbi:MAG: LacI family DNA-binding transcriptional regulator [Chthoniobacterales bacterium]
MKIQKVSLDNIAKIAGVHKATVSRALRNHPAIPLATRERIKEIAREQGYRPNPIVSMYQAQARSNRPSRMQAAFAWISDYPVTNAWSTYPWLKGYYHGALERCENLGYRLEQVKIEVDGTDPAEEVEKLLRVLRSKGIFGVVLPLMLHSQFVAQKWKDCAVSVIGNAHLGHPDGVEGVKRSFYPRGFEIAERDMFYNTRLSLMHLKELGYLRVGFLYSRYMDNEANSAARSAFLTEQENVPEKDRIPMLFIERFKEGRPAEFDEWVDKYRPEVIICVNPRVREWVVERGLRIPEDIGLVNLNLVSDVAGWSGINEQHKEIGAAAIDLLVGQLSRNEIGNFNHPRKILVPGVWVDGATLKMPYWQESVDRVNEPSTEATSVEDLAARDVEEAATTS